MPNRKQAEGVRHVYLDHLGSIRQIATGAGHHAAFHTCFPFGEEAPPIEHDGEAMKFTGHERDFNGSTTATMQHLDYMHARYYNPNLARFLTIDPGRDNHPSQPQSWNLYAYTRGNPMKYVDPDGQATLPAAKVVLAGAVVGVAGHVAVGTLLNHSIEGMPLKEAFRTAWRGWRGAATVGALSTLRGGWVATAPAAAGLMEYREQRRRGASTEQALEHAGVVAFATCVGLLCGKATGARISLEIGKTTDGTITGAVAAGAAAEGGATLSEAIGVGVPQVIAIPEGSSDNLGDRLDQTQTLRDVSSEVDEERRP